MNSSTHNTRFNLKRCAGLMLAALFSLAVTACATVEGAGEDIESAGEAIQDAADDN